MKSWLMRFLWASIVGVAIAAYAYHKSLWPRWLRQCRYKVLEVQQETHDVWTLKLEPAIPGGTISYLPGQFHFLTLHRQGFPVEEHPFTISSSPTESFFLTSTIKESGDFTKTVRQTRVGDPVSVRGPFGRFSYLLHSEQSELVFLVGGIGITPVMSMLRYMRDSRDWKPALLIYNNRTERDIVFREEVDDIVGVSHSCLRVVHILSKPDNGWKGERGHIDRELIVRLAGDDLPSKGYYICGPPRMAQAVITIVRNLGVPPSRIHTELYSL